MPTRRPPLPMPAASGPGPEPRRSAWPPEPEEETGPTGPTPAGPPVTFLPGEAPQAPSRSGWRGALNRLGLSLRPGEDEQRYRDDVASVSRRWTGPRTIVIANGKGGASKTPLTIALAAVFGRYGGGVCAWGNHQMRGTLLWHLEANPHARTTRDLLAAAPQLLAADGRLSDVADYLHHQPQDHFDVLSADPTLTADQQRANHETVGTLHDVLSRFYRLILIDSDNDESSTHWLGAIGRADQLVVATTNDDVVAETARLMLEDLPGRGEHAGRLAADAVVVVSKAHVGPDARRATDVARRFTDDLGLATAVIPHDPAMKQIKIRYDNLRPDTRRAYLAAAALIARDL